MKTSMKFLLIDDDPVERSLTAKILADRFVDAQVIEVTNYKQFEHLLSQADFDLIISEFHLGWSTTGLKLFKQVRDRYSCIPFIILTGFGNEEIAVAAIKAGVDDYLSKDRRSQLINSISQCLTKLKSNKICHATDKSALLCEKWDLAISRLTSDFAYSMHISANGKLVFEWFTEPLKKFIFKESSLHEFGFPVHPDDKKIVKHHFDKLMAGIEDTTEYRVINSNGKIHYFRDHALPIRDWSKGKVIRLYGAIQDITHQRQAEEKLYLMQHAIDSSNNGIIITAKKEKDYAIIYANQSFVAMTGYTMEELLGQNPRFLQREDNDQPGILTLRTAIKENRDVCAIIRNYRKDGALFWNEVYVSPVYNKQHNITHYIGVQNDVTRRIKMDKLLSNNEAKLRAIFNNVMDGIIITDKDAYIESLNPSVEKMFGYSINELIGKSIEQLISKDKLQQVNLNIEELTDQATEACGLRKNGKDFPVKLGISKVNFDQYALLIFTIQDISECKQAENALRKLSRHLELAREEERSWIAREIHDELGSKLTALKMGLSWLGEKLTKQSPAYENKITTMHQQIDNAIHTVQQIATDLRPSILDHLGLSAAIEWQIDNFRQQSGLTCHLSIPEQAIEIDEQRATAIFRITQESLTNIIRHAHATTVKLDIQAIDNKLSLSITDNGKGMTILQMNNPEKFGIQGMHERAKHFGGEFSIKSSPGKGCTMTLIFHNMP